MHQPKRRKVLEWQVLHSGHSCKLQHHEEWALSHHLLCFVRTAENEILRDFTFVVTSMLVERSSLHHVIGAEFKTGAPERRLPVRLFGPFVAIAGLRQKSNPTQGPQYMGKQKPRVIVVFTLGKRLLRKLQRQVPRRAVEWRNLLQPERGANPDRAMAHPLHYDQAAQLIGLSSARARKHRSNGPETDNALAIKPDHPIGARHSLSHWKTCIIRN